MNQPLSPIGEIRSVAGWKTLPIRECGEPLVPLTGHPRITTDAQYADDRHAPIFVRQGVAQRLARASESLPSGLALLVWDGYRPLAMQRRLFERLVEELENSGSPHDQAQADAERFVSAPSADPAHPAPHQTGGAVDLTLARDDGSSLLMGTGFDEVREETATRFYETPGQDALSGSDRAIRDNRRMLWHAMTGAGFSNYSEEWWHYDFGNQFDCARTGRPAIYGVITQ